MPLDGGTPPMETQSAFMAAAAAAVLLFAVLRVRRDSPAILFGTLTAAFGVWCATRGAHDLGWTSGSAVGGIALALLGGLAPTVAASFVGGGPRLGMVRSALWLGTPAVVASLFALGAEHPLARLVTTGWALAGASLGTMLLLRFGPIRNAPDSPDATRMRYLAAAHAAVVLGIGIDLVAASFGVAQVAATLAPLLYLYAGYLHLAQIRVPDLRQLMGNALSLTFLAGALAASFAALWLWVGPRLDLFAFNAFVASFLLLLLLEPGRRTIQRAVDRRFVAPRLELESGIRPLRERLPQLLTLDDVLSELLETVESISRLRASAVFLRDDPHVGFQQVGSVGLPPRRRVNLIRNPDWVRALETGEPLLADDLAKQVATRAQGAGREGLLRLVRQLDAQLVLPLRTESQLFGFWTLTDERSSEPFSSTELELLGQVAEEVARAIESSKTFERVRVRDRLASLGEMAAGLAHEIRNPLATIRGALAVIRDPESEQEREFHDVIVEEIERLDRVVASFLDYAKPVTLPGPILDLGDFVRGCAESVARRFASDGIRLHFDIDSAVPAAAANAYQLERVISNLATNAYQALDGKGTVRVTVRRGELGAEPDQTPEIASCVEILIEDDGPGMDEATLERALIPFYTTREEGTGLGLALCDRLVRAQGGSLELRSRPEEGTVALIRLPERAAAETDE